MRAKFIFEEFIANVNVFGDIYEIIKNPPPDKMISEVRFISNLDGDLFTLVPIDYENSYFMSHRNLAHFLNYKGVKISEDPYSHFGLKNEVSWHRYMKTNRLYFAESYRDSDLKKLNRVAIENARVRNPRWKFIEVGIHEAR